MILRVHTVSSLPNLPSVYAIYGKNHEIPIYIGKTKTLKERIKQHLISRNSSIVTGQNGYSLDPDYVEKVAWWQHEYFYDPSQLEAAELIGFEQMNPIIRSQGNKTKKAIEKKDDINFEQEMIQLFQEQPCGELIITNLNQALKRITELEDRLEKLEERSK